MKVICILLIIMRVREWLRLWLGLNGNVSFIILNIFWDMKIRGFWKINVEVFCCFNGFFLVFVFFYGIVNVFNVISI